MTKNNHLIELDVQTGTEYYMGDIDGYVSDPAYFFERAAEVARAIKYTQVEFSDMPSTLCTLYGNMNALASRIGRELTNEERRELCQLRLADKDFSPEVGGLTSAGADTVRRWWNTHNPLNKVFTCAIDVSEDLGRKFFAKNFPVSTSVRGNTAYSIDNRDGVLNATSWGKTTFGHCRMRMGMTFHDNYKDKGKWREYSYPSIEAYLESMKNGYERPIMYAFFLENELSGDGKKLVDAMKAGLWNGQRENDLLTRWEASRIAMRISLGKIDEKVIWNGKDGDKPASKYEYFTMLTRASKKYSAYTGTDRNQNLTRKQAILAI